MNPMQNVWNENTSIDDPRVVKIKNQLIESGIVPASSFEITNNLHPEYGTTHYPIIFICDFSISVKNFRKIVEQSFHNFDNGIRNSKNILSSCLDLCVVEFSDTVRVSRKFGYVSGDTVETLSEFKPAKGKHQFASSGNSKLATAMFVAWYNAEARKRMYKESGMKSRESYKQPLFVIISDLGNNDSTSTDGVPLIQSMYYLYNNKCTAYKLGVIKALVGNVSFEYDEALKGCYFDRDNNPDFANMLKKLFAKLLSTYCNPEEPDAFIKPVNQNKEKPVPIPVPVIADIQECEVQEYLNMLYGHECEED